MATSLWSHREFHYHRRLQQLYVSSELLYSSLSPHTVLPTSHARVNIFLCDRSEGSGWRGFVNNNAVLPTISMDRQPFSPLLRATLSRSMLVCVFTAGHNEPISSSLTSPVSSFSPPDCSHQFVSNRANLPTNSSFFFVMTYFNPLSFSFHFLHICLPLIHLNYNLSLQAAHQPCPN